MLKTHERFFAYMQRFVDIAVSGIAWFIAYYFRFDVIEGGQDGLESLFVRLFVLIFILNLYFFSKNNLYRSYRFNSRYKEIVAIFKANSQSILMFIILLYFFANNRISRIVIVSYYVISQILLVSVRLSVRNLLRYLRRRGRNLRHVLLVGNGLQLIQYLKTIKSFKDAGIKIIGWIDSKGLANNYKIADLKMSIEDARIKFQPASIVIGYNASKSYKVEKIVKLSQNNLTPIQILPDLTHSFIGHYVENFAGMPLITINHPNQNIIDYLVKRIFDMGASSIGLVILSPLFFIVSILIKLTSRGPVFYGQERMGLDGRTFRMWKFRSMKINAEEKSGAVWAIKDDQRRTTVGAFLRSTSLDELPQIWNVLIGDMSLVGPRPERPVFVNKFKNEVPSYMLRHKVKAGITGWAQVNGWRGNTSLKKRIECDIYYIKNWSIWFDIKIIFLTLWKGLVNKNAY